MKLSAKIFLITVFICLITLPVLANDYVKNSIVKIYTVRNEYLFQVPWQIKTQNSISGSGCIISDNRILTNAHIISNQTFIQVRKAGKTKKYTVKVEVVGHECDLAILKVNDESFFSDVIPLKVGDLPKIRDKVAVYGFPEGGDKLCITEGVVSRIEHSMYSHSGTNLLSCQIDAAINSGNSGGPVIKGDKIIGVAFQSLNEGENIGYMVPAPVIKHFLEDIQDGKYNGTPGLGISYQRMENPDIRDKFCMDKNMSGVMINLIFPDSPFRELLRQEDIILSIDGHNVENDGTTEFRKGERTTFTYFIEKKHINDMATFEILRNGKIETIKIKLSKPLDFESLVPYYHYDTPPTYYIMGGLIFVPLKLNYFDFWEDDWLYMAPADLINYYVNGNQEKDRKEVVVLARVLADELTIGYQDLTDKVISHVNGKKVSTIKDLINAIENNKKDYHTIIAEDGFQIVLNKNRIVEDSQNILKKYQIYSDRSEDLK